MNKNRKFKEVENSKLLVRKIVGEGTDNQGRRVIKTQWFEAMEELNLGSHSNPKNNDIVAYKYEIPDPKKKNIFEGLFK